MKLAPLGERAVDGVIGSDRSALALALALRLSAMRTRILSKSSGSPGKTGNILGRSANAVFASGTGTNFTS